MGWLDGQLSRIPPHLSTICTSIINRHKSPLYIIDRYPRGTLLRHGLGKRYQFFRLFVLSYIFDIQKFCFDTGCPPRKMRPAGTNWAFLHFRRSALEFRCMGADSGVDHLVIFYDFSGIFHYLFIGACAMTNSSILLKNVLLPSLHSNGL